MKKNNTGFIAAIAVLALLLIGGAFLYFQEKNQNQEITEILEDEKLQLTKELETLSTDYSDLKTDNDTLNYQLELEKAKIDELIKELKQSKNNTYSQLKKYKGEISSLKGLIKEYAFKVDSLNMLSYQLQEENEFYREEVKVKTAKVDSLSSSNEELQKLVSKVSVLEPMNLKAYPTNRRNKEVRRLGWTKKIKVDFTFPKNLAVEAGGKDIYIVVTRPDKVIVSNPLGETFPMNGEDVVYTMKRTVYYENDVLPVSLFWDNDKSLIKGDYTVAVILDGRIIGSTNMFIK